MTQKLTPQEKKLRRQNRRLKLLLASITSGMRPTWVVMHLDDGRTVPGYFFPAGRVMGEGVHSRARRG